MRTMALRALRLLAQIEIHPTHTARALRALPGYLRDWRRFAARCDWPMAPYPCLLDRSASAASLGEYFWQDLYVARRILQAAPRRHIDIGSRIDGFVAHLACVRPVEVYDIRPLPVTIPNVGFRQWDLTEDGEAAPGDAADSVSCLHTLEHVGLGRYGDRIDPEGWRVGLRRLAGLVAPGGRLWLSVPVGRRRVEFNAHRVFDPVEVLQQAQALGLARAEFSVIEASGRQRFVEGDAAIARVAHEDDALGIFLFERPPVV